MAFPRARRLELARAIHEAGIEEIEAGIPAMGADSESDFALLARELPGARLIAWNRASKGDIEASARAGARVAHICVPASDAMLRSKLGWDRERAIDELSGLLEYCRIVGLEAIVGAEDASRADPGFLLLLFKAAVSGGASRLRYADTVGAQDPFSARDAISSLVAALPVPIEYHGHNDLGLATANALAAIDAGGTASATVGGLGERAGNASLEQLACASALLRGDDLGVRLDRLVPLSALVAELSGRPIPRDRPIVGELAFSHESGIHVDGLLKEPGTYEFLRPELVGRTRCFVPGAFSGAKALRHCARSLGYELEGPELRRLTSLVKAAWERGAPLDPWEAFAAILLEEFAR